MSQPVEETVTSVKEFVAYIVGLAADHSDVKFIFRGQSDSKWGLVPAVQRQLEREVMDIDASNAARNTKDQEKESARRELLENEKSMLKEFKNESIPYIGRFDRYSDDLEWLALAQHHYLPTRLLDWTYHAATALYFAVNGVIRTMRSGFDDDLHSDKYCVVWIAQYSDEYSVDKIQAAKGKWAKINPNFDPFNIDPSIKGKKEGTVLFYDPPHITSRLAAQQSCFTLHSSRYQVNFVQWPTDFDIIKILIPYSKVRSIKRDLRLLGNRGASLFPGLDGIAFDIVSKYDFEKRRLGFPP